MSATEAIDHAHSAGHHDHDHSHLPFQAHHFDDPEQQFDAGKLGMWLFLVTEVLFFSGMFCAYALYRSLHPEVFTFSSRYLNATLGAINTGVLLFSSLTMAWGVRCAQLRQRTGLVVCLAMTLGCASIFLGVKAIEYSHKWGLGLLVAGEYVTQSLPNPEAHAISTDWLVRFSIVPGVAVVGFLIWYLACLAKGDKRQAEVAGPLLVTALCFFVGVGLGLVIEGGGEGHDAHGAEAHASSSAHHDTDGHHHADEGTAHNAPAPAVHLPETTSMFAADFEPGQATDADVDKPGRAGLFFSIYYCMTGVHAIHIIAGMLVLAWLLMRATKDHFNEQYFGPVDYVGLYWHLVDLIWIYLFPLLYLIK
jgi:cytochrome c oxidase subunit III